MFTIYYLSAVVCHEKLLRCVLFAAVAVIIRFKMDLLPPLPHSNAVMLSTVAAYLMKSRCA